MCRKGRVVMIMPPFWRQFFGARVVKTSVAAGMALYGASFLHFPGYTYAAMVAVLAMQKSLARSFGLAKRQITSALIGTVSGSLVAWQFGTHPLIGGLLVYALFVIHLRIGWKDSILLSIVTAINSFSTFNGELLVHGGKQVLIILIGVGSSIVVNLVAVPRYEEKLDDLLARSEAMLRSLVFLMYNNLSYLDQRFPREAFEKQVAEVRAYMGEAMHYAELMAEDQWIDSNKGREAQKAIQTLEQMELLPVHLLSLNRSLERVDIWLEPIPILQRLLEVVMRVQVRVFQTKRVPFRAMDQAIENLDRFFAEMELPKTRLEFMSRSSLYQFYNDIKLYYEDLKLISKQGS